VASSADEPVLGWRQVDLDDCHIGLLVQILLQQLGDVSSENPLKPGVKIGIDRLDGQQKPSRFAL
jgi:hypothetical protein